MDYKEHIASKLTKLTDLSLDDISSMLEIPPSSQMGDFALPCFKLSKAMRKSPVMISDMLYENLETDDIISKIESSKGYLNFYLNKESLSSKVINDILEKGEAYGSSNEGDNKTICLDYSSINIAKHMHIGHLSTTVIGHSLYRIFTHLGYDCVSINHLGDWGTQFGKLIVAFKLYSSYEKISAEGIDELDRIYVKYHAEAENDKSMDDQARAWFKKIEDGDEEALSLFKYFKEITINEVKKIYDLMDIQFDSYNGESFYADKMEPVLQELEDKNLLVSDAGAKIIKLDDYNMPPYLILKRDGATLYSTRDITAVLYRKKTYNFHKDIYITAYEQDLHFKQLFKVIELMGYDYYKDLVHVNYGWVSMVDGAMSTRSGNTIKLDELLERSIAKSLDIINEKNPNLENKEEVAEMVGIGATVFAALKNNRIKDMTFSWDSALSFDGETAPYVQYTHARCCSLIEKSEISIDGECDYSTLDNEHATAVITLLRDFPDIIESAATRYEPSLVTRFSVDLAKAFNKYYFEHRIIDEDSIEKNRARIALTQSVVTTIKTALYLIGVKAPKKM